MTVSYTHLSHTAGWLGGLTRLLFIWKGSLWKQIWPDFCLFFSLYALLSLLYRFILMDYEHHKIQYELFCVYCDKFCKVIPIGFLLGFYVTQVVSRWWAQFMSLPWPDTLARYLAVYLPGTDEISRNYRRTLVRWVNLANVMALRLVSYKVMVRFPSYDHLVSSGLATPRELIKLNRLNDLIQSRHQISWYPTMWSQNLLRKARKEGLIANDWFAHVLIKEVDSMANMNGMLICYGWINIPLVYTQVVTLAVYAYFVACLFGRQYLLPTQYKVEGGSYVPVAKFQTVANWTGTLTPGADNLIGYDNESCDFFIPVFTILEYLFYMGWLKVAETLLNPFGEDDDDFDTYYLIDRNLQIAYVMVDEAGAQIEPELDPFNSSSAPELKHTALSLSLLDDARPHLPTTGLNLKQEQTNIAEVPRYSNLKNVSIGSKLNLAGSYLAVPVNELTTGQSIHELRNGGDGLGFGAFRSTRSSAPGGQVDRRTSIQGQEAVPVQTPGTSRNENQLFAVQPRATKGSQGVPSAPPRLLPTGLACETDMETAGGEAADINSVFEGDGW